MEAYIIDGVRTPIGNYQGSLANVRPDDLGALVIKTIAEKHPEIPADAYDDVIMGCANQAGKTTEMWQECRCYLLDCRKRFPGKRSIGCAVRVCRRLFMRIVRLKPVMAMCLLRVASKI